MTDEKIEAVISSSRLAHRALPDGRELNVIALTFGRARLTIGPPYDCGYYDDAW